jgi:hypothetical protein
VAAGSGSPSSPPPPPPDETPKPRDFTRILRNDLHARDMELGLSRSGPLVTAAHQAASPDIGPDVGTATIEVESDASGALVAVRVLDASGDAGPWQAVAAEIRRLMASKPLRVPSGSRGVRADLRIVVERVLPSGEKTAVKRGAAPDETCDTTGGGRRCVAGMPGGVGGTWGDVSNIGARRSRVVHVQLVGEALL